MPVWLDLMASPSEWAASFLSDEAAEVLAVLGGLMLIFALPGPPAQSTAVTAAEPVREAIAQMGQVVKKGLGGWEWDGVRLAIGVGDTASDADAEEWDELCAEAGMEFVQLGASQPALNTFGGMLWPCFLLPFIIHFFFFPSIFFLASPPGSSPM